MRALFLSSCPWSQECQPLGRARVNISVRRVIWQFSQDQGHVSPRLGNWSWCHLFRATLELRARGMGLCAGHTAGPRLALSLL